MTASFRLAVLIPCRDEEAVLGRKLRNTLSLDFPGGGPHAVIVADDHSRDVTVRALAREAGRGSPIEVRYVRSDRTPGKAGAVAAGLEAARGFDAVVLTDADVLLEAGTLRRLTERLAEPGVGLVSGEQRFVSRIGREGAEGGADTFYDRFSRAVRRLESRRGFVFSVHGECLAWRPADRLVPEAGLASDDIDLALAARRRGLRVVYAEGARFFEARPGTSSGRLAQDLRRARSYVQFVARRARALVDPSFSPRDRAKLLFYFAVPLAAPFVGALLLLAALLLPFALHGASRAIPILLLLALTAWPAARDGLRRLGILGRAIVEYGAGIRASDRWEPLR